MHKNPLFPHCVLMIGTAFETMGGISTVVNTYRENGLFERCNVTYVSTHCDGSKIKKIVNAMLAFFKCVYLLLFRSVDVVHIHLSSRASFWRKAVFILLCRLFSKPLIVHLHGSEFREFFDQELGGKLRKVAVWIFSTADVIVTLSLEWEKWVKATVDGPRVLTIQNSINPLYAEGGSERNSNQLLFLGRIGTRKGAYDLIRALKDVKEHYPKVRLLMGGDGEIDQAKSLVKELSLEDNVEFIGWVKGGHKNKLLFESSMFILPSYNEGMPMSILEALAAGLPVISTTIGGIPEQVTDGVEGFLIEPGDVEMLSERIQTLLGSSDLRAQMSSAARKKFNSSFSADKLLPQLENLYAQLAVGKSH
ncbi:MAG: glycosyltransferase involved in cell wall biosynthesis [Porticoccaceae bacterium]|jgi:glycosyltransferase involved in cell wall biosynthesis